MPFRQVYIHALVRDAERQKMSKTKGNVVDPLEVIERFGTDATRFTLAAMAAPGTDIAFSESRTEGYRDFRQQDLECGAVHVHERGPGRAGPAAREQVETRSCTGSDARRCRVSAQSPLKIAGFFRASIGSTADVNEAWRLIVSRGCEPHLRFFLGRVLRLVYRTDQAAAELRGGRGRRTSARIACANLVNLFEASLRLLHPVMPFITEEIWHAIYDGKPPLKSIALAAYPQADEKQIDLAAETEMAILQDLIVSVRNLRAELKVEPKVKSADRGVRA